MLGAIDNVRADDSDACGVAPPRSARGQPREQPNVRRRAIALLLLQDQHAPEES